MYCQVIKNWTAGRITNGAKPQTLYKLGGSFNHEFKTKEDEVLDEVLVHMGLMV